MVVEISQTQLPSLLLLTVLLGAVVVAVYLSLKSGDKYSVEDADRDAISFADIIREAEGPMTAFLIAAFIIIIIWAIAYLVLYLK
ncbi:MAG: hypothetical protein C3F06_05990 [Candidatus Methanoperedenaceae archaeon]|nr:MAG: hypothetical protein C3F06_05990 [Candidatus Methanoperedenaceae archaeon]